MATQLHDPQSAVARTIKRGSTAAERARTEALLARYPRLDHSEIGELKGWFNRRATAADVASLASNERLYPNYRAFSRLHIEPFTLWEKAIIATLTSLPFALVAIGLAVDA